MADAHLVAAFDAGHELHETQPDLMLADVGRRATARHPDDKEGSLWFVEGFKTARRVRDEFQQERRAAS